MKVMGIGHMSMLAAAWSHGLAHSSIMLELQGDGFVEIIIMSFYSYLLHDSVYFTFTVSKPYAFVTVPSYFSTIGDGHRKRCVATKGWVV